MTSPIDVTRRTVCICPPAPAYVDDEPAGLCLGVPGETTECAACLALDPEAPCLAEAPSWSWAPFRSWPDALAVANAAAQATGYRYWVCRGLRGWHVYWVMPA